MPGTSEEVKGIIARQLEIKYEKVTEDASIIDDLGADSLDVIEFTSILEEKFDIHIPEENANSLKTVGDLVSYINGKLTQK